MCQQHNIATLIHPKPVLNCSKNSAYKNEQKMNKKLANEASIVQN